MKWLLVTLLLLPSVLALPSSWDWRNAYGQDWVTPVKNQSEFGKCGACWIFSSVAAFESHLQIKRNRIFPLDLSEQDILENGSCGWGCSGGLPWKAFKCMQNGITDESCHPFRGKNGSEICEGRERRLWKLDHYFFLPESAAKSYLLKGPIVANIGVKEYYDSYFDEKGIYRCEMHERPGQGNHYIMLVGYNDTGGYWIVKNSWGEEWGEDGFFKLGYGECGISKYLSPLLSQPGLFQEFQGFNVENIYFLNLSENFSYILIEWKGNLTLWELGNGWEKLGVSSPNRSLVRFEIKSKRLKLEGNGTVYRYWLEDFPDYCEMNQKWNFTVNGTSARILKPDSFYEIKVPENESIWVWLDCDRDGVFENNYTSNFSAIIHTPERETTCLIRVTNSSDSCGWGGEMTVFVFNDTSPPWPEKRNYGITGNATILVKIYDESAVHSAKARIRWQNGNLTLELKDDGKNCDKSAGDRYYGNCWQPSEPTRYEIDLILEDVHGNKAEYRAFDNFSLAEWHKNSSFLLVDSSYHPELIKINADKWIQEERGNVPLNTLLQYPVVIWLDSDSYPYSSRDDIKKYLSAGGRLLISGQNLEWMDYYYSDFYNNYLHSDYVRGDTDIRKVLGIEKDPISNGMILELEAGDPGEIVPIDATPIFYYENVSLPEIESSLYERPSNGCLESCVAGIRYNGSYKLVYLAFDLAKIKNESIQKELLKRAIGWLLANISRENENMTVSLPVLAQNISYILDGKEEILCRDCLEARISLENLSDGTYNLEIRFWIENESYSTFLWPEINRKAPVFIEILPENLSSTRSRSIIIKVKVEDGNGIKECYLDNEPMELKNGYWKKEKRLSYGWNEFRICAQDKDGKENCTSLRIRKLASPVRRTVYIIKQPEVSQKTKVPFLSSNITSAKNITLENKTENVTKPELKLVIKNPFDPLLGIGFLELLALFLIFVRHI